MKRKIAYAFGCTAAAVFLAFIVFSVSNERNRETASAAATAWQAVRPVPFVGYICGYEGTETFLQLPIFFPKGSAISIEDISSITFTNQEQEFLCSNYQLSSFQDSKVEEYQMATLSFRVELSRVGESVFDHLKIRLKDEDVLDWRLGEIKCNVIETQPEFEALSMSQFIVNQSDLSAFKVEYVNHTDEEIEIQDFVYPGDMDRNLQITKYKDFNLTEEENDFTIPPKEKRTFLITVEDSYSEEKKFYYMLPFVSFSYEGETQQMPAQTQATVVQALFTEEFISELMK